jgi:dihydrofolate reductase
MARRLNYFVAATLDGFIASPDGEFDRFVMEGDHMAAITALYPDALPVHFHELAGVSPTGTVFDTVVMGWNTYAVGLAEGITSPYGHLRQYVFSSRDRTVGDDVTLVQGDPVETVRTLKAETGGTDIWLCGGGQLAATLMDEIDDLVLKLHPVTFGAGIPLFASGYEPRRWDLVDTIHYDSGVSLVRMRSSE